jgi:hypothetical protein
MRGLSRLIIGLIIVWATVAITETAGVPILPRGHVPSAGRTAASVHPR